MICFRCREREANPVNFGTCDLCDDAPSENAFAHVSELVEQTVRERTLDTRPRHDR